MEGLSFGQAAGLKDDLDVDDNDIGEKKRQAFLDLLMEAGQKGTILTDNEVKEQVDTIMFEVRNYEARLQRIGIDRLSAARENNVGERVTDIICDYGPYKCDALLST